MDQVRTRSRHVHRPDNTAIAARLEAIEKRLDEIITRLDEIITRLDEMKNLMLVLEHEQL